MTFSKKARITGMGSYIPEKILTNKHLEALVDTNDEWITTRTGIKERRIARDDEMPSDMGAAAAKNAIAQAGIGIEDIDFIVVATMTPDFPSPSTGAIIQAKLGAKCGAMDVQAACTGFLYGLSTAKAFVESGTCRHVLFIATEKMSSIINYKDRNTCIIFGDGASAAVVSAHGNGLAIGNICLGSDGELSSLAHIPGGGAVNPASQNTLEKQLHYFQMEGKELFKHAVRRMAQAAKDCLEQSKIPEEKISWLVPHQANVRIMDAMAKNFNIADDKVCKTIHKYGNTSAAGMGITLDELNRTHHIENGENLLLVAFGGGLTWGATVLTKVEES